MFKEALSVSLLWIQLVFIVSIVLRVGVTEIYNKTHTNNILINKIKFNKIPYKTISFCNPMIFIALIIMFQGSVK